LRKRSETEVASNVSAAPKYGLVEQKKRREMEREISLSPFAALRKPQMEREISTG
jgi:hypothetical protein